MRVILVYLALGAALALASDAWRRETSVVARLTNAALTLTAWPIFAPLVWLAKPARAHECMSPFAQHIHCVLSEARAAVAGTTLEELLPARLLEVLDSALQKVDRRHAELESLLARPEFQAPGPSASLPHLSSLRRLREMHQHDQYTLAEIGKLSEALRAQLLVARYSGQKESRPGGGDPSAAAKDLALELASRVESLGAWFDLDSTTHPVDTRLSD